MFLLIFEGHQERAGPCSSCCSPTICLCMKLNVPLISFLYPAILIQAHGEREKHIASHTRGTREHSQEVCTNMGTTVAYWDGSSVTGSPAFKYHTSVSY